MKFQEFSYQRPNYDDYAVSAKKDIEQLKQATTVESFMKGFYQINQLRNHINTMATLASIRYSINTADPFYMEENTYWDEQGPLYNLVDNELYQTVLNTPLRKELEAVIPAPFFALAQNSLDSFNEKIIEELQKENALSTEYAKLIASAEIPFEGETYTLSTIKAKTLSADRATRKKATEVRMNWFKENGEALDSIYDQLVHVRDKMAKKMGYENFIQLGYKRMNRLDYNETMVAEYRKQVLEDLVPYDQMLYQKQIQRLGLDKLRYYDESIEFLSGNPLPKGSPEELVQKAKRMYEAMSPETAEFFVTMEKQQLFDLVAKPNKQGGGYCTEISDYKVPFIFSNFNGTSEDVDVLTHEAGHAFQSYTTLKTITIPECAFPTYESAEIHSMSMEFFCYPYMKSFFEQDTQKYYYLHLTHALKFIPYGILVDAFQHEVYRNPDLTPAERKKTWRTLEKQYCPQKNYEGCTVLEEGGWWYQQGHIFSSPFYYIDYTLAQVCALQFFARTQANDPTAWSDYYHLCTLGGTKSFLGLLAAAHLQSPFEEGTIKKALEPCKAFLATIDDQTL